MTKLRLPVLYVTPEMDKNQLNARMLARITGVDASMIQTNTQHYGSNAILLDWTLILSYRARFSIKTVIWLRSQP